MILLNISNLLYDSFMLEVVILCIFRSDTNLDNATGFKILHLLWIISELCIRLNWENTIAIIIIIILG